MLLSYVNSISTWCISGGKRTFIYNLSYIYTAFCCYCFCCFYRKAVEHSSSCVVVSECCLCNIFPRENDPILLIDELTSDCWQRACDLIKYRMSSMNGECLHEVAVTLGVVPQVEVYQSCVHHHTDFILLFLALTAFQNVHKLLLQQLNTNTVNKKNLTNYITHTQISAHTH